MKRIIILFAVITLAACNKAITDRVKYSQPLSPAKLDESAGNWMPILLNSATEFAVPVPQLVSGDAYKAEVNEVRQMNASISVEQQKIIRYWAAGGVLRWNEIMRELVALHNLPPYQNGDGTYPFPNAANPFAYPTFPFANPPYAARAYAYVAAAQYDALVACYKYKGLYNRMPPYRADRSIQPQIPVQELPSYPSEDAVLAGVTGELLKLLFPADTAYISLKINEQKNYRLWAGVNVRSDLDAGEALGKSVASKFITRARADKTGAAVGNAALWAQLETQTVAKGEIPWISQETPKRPPMLPLFGNVRTWLMDSATLISTRAPAPPLTGSEQFKKETEEVKWYADHPSRERMEIVHFWADGVGTYTPPGHWNAIACEDFVSQSFSEVRWARNLALLNMAMMDAAINCWNTKFFYFNPRPSQVDPSIKTLTGLPNFPSYTSGHSTFSAAAATVLGYIMPTKATGYNNMAKEASNSRMYGAIHYRSDCEGGLECGNRVGAFAVTRGRADGAN
ncbi:MAG: phosphatase PAP2 family protein [Bacteroidota bacterium]